jgi:hypothetical protein
MADKGKTSRKVDGKPYVYGRNYARMHEWRRGGLLMWVADIISNTADNFGSAQLEPGGVLKESR